jgi:uncharacterized membrane protein YfcA
MIPSVFIGAYFGVKAQKKSSDKTINNWIYIMLILIMTISLISGSFILANGNSIFGTIW